MSVACSRTVRCDGGRHSAGAWVDNGECRQTSVVTTRTRLGLKARKFAYRSCQSGIVIVAVTLRDELVLEGRGHRRYW
jgi:hypothetical protein